ncbi:MAG: AAA family ATPase [Thermodesulfobacteria bacterium]|nr:AAA family ATPase [Thermodesulfobacteriota bacterium]
MERLDADKLRLTIDADGLGFDFLSQFEEKGRVIFGQERADRALDVGLEIKGEGFNVFVAGLQEAGAMELTLSKLKKLAEDEQARPRDICYIYNFQDPDVPLAILLDPGEGMQLKRDMAELVDNLQLHMPKSFEGETYLVRKEEVIREFNTKRTQLFEELDKKVREKGFILQSDPTGMMVIPAKEDGSPLSPEEISKLTQEEQDDLKRRSEELHREMGAVMRQVHQLEQEVRQKLKELDREVARQTASMLIEPLKRKYERYPRLKAYFDSVLEDVVLHFQDFLPAKNVPPQGMPFPMPGAGPSFTRYDVNVLVDNSEAKGRPFIFEANPSYPNLFGVIERQAQFGALLTDFTMIKAGALHKANGGFLVLKVMDLLKRPFSYEALKRALKTKKLEIEDPGEQYGLFTTKSLKPEPINLDVKIVLMGEPYLYQMLYNYDEDFRELFKIKSHLDVWTDNTSERQREFLEVLVSVREKHGLMDIDKTGAARFLEFAAELADSREKLSLKITEVEDLAIEANFWAQKSGSQFISRDHVQKAIDERRYRSSLYQEHLQELLVKDVIKVATDGTAVGQINGLAVYNLGDYIFGKPSRITVNTCLGKDGIVNIEREAELSGKIHTKGVMILSGYLRQRFAQEKPLSLTATICFEQSYSMVDGDSASGAELFGLLSALSGVPLRQDIACTGAVSQKGEILPVGGVTAKIEGFFDLCKARGLTGQQGVIIPKANVRDLNLRHEIVQAVRDGKFNVWAIETVEEGVELLTGMKAGKADEEGRYPEGTLFHLVDKRLKHFSELAKREEKEEEEKEKDKDKGPSSQGDEGPDKT